MRNDGFLLFSALHWICARYHGANVSKQWKRCFRYCHAPSANRTAGTHDYQRGGICKWSGNTKMHSVQFRAGYEMQDFFNGKAGPEYPSPAPPIGQAQLFTPGPKMNMRGRGRWPGWEIIGSFQLNMILN